MSRFGSAEPLGRFAVSLGAVLDDAAGHEATVFHRGAPLLEQLVSDDGWLPPEFADARDRAYGSYLLYADPAERFVVVSFAWSDGAETPIHDHTVWGMIGVMRGCEISQRYRVDGACALVAEREDRLEAGGVDTVSPTVGDIHKVRNGAGASVSIHVYGADLVKRPHLAYDARSGKSRMIFSDPFLNQAPLISHL
jgi:predicted metal-dependent enzyme (double-stranded beta helix superfamily)